MTFFTIVTYYREIEINAIKIEFSTTNSLIFFVIFGEIFAYSKYLDQLKRMIEGQKIKQSEKEMVNILSNLPMSMAVVTNDDEKSVLFTNNLFQTLSSKLGLENFSSLVTSKVFMNGNDKFSLVDVVDNVFELVDNKFFKISTGSAA